MNLQLPTSLPCTYQLCFLHIICLHISDWLLLRHWSVHFIYTWGVSNCNGDSVKGNQSEYVRGQFQPIRPPYFQPIRSQLFSAAEVQRKKCDIHIKRAAFLSSSEELTSLEFIPPSIDRPTLIKLILSFVSIQGCRISKPLCGSIRVHR